MRQKSDTRCKNSCPRECSQQRGLAVTHAVVGGKTNAELIEAGLAFRRVTSGWHGYWISSAPDGRSGHWDVDQESRDE